MAIYQCKQCGGTLNPTSERGVAICDSCGCHQTIPTDVNEKISGLFIRANDLRRKNEFDKATSIYSLILEDDPNNAEAYWGLLLCEYGIEYVVDDRTGVHIPTCHRLSSSSLLDNTNYTLAVRYADVVASEIYKKEGVTLEELRRRVAEKTRNVEPVDIFICYKELGANGERTIDSVLAQKIYRRLTQEGYKVFYARETLKQHPGEEYEPYIFSALHSAKVMLVITTNLIHLNAVWVKNEWSRYIALMKSEPNENRRLVPCVSQMAIDDLPMEFLVYEGVTLDDIGAEEDLVLGLEKYLKGLKSLGIPTPKADTMIPNLLVRAKQCLNFGEWERAYECFQRVLDVNAQCAEAFLGLILAQNEMSDRDALAQYLKTHPDSPIFNDPNFKIGICEYADMELRGWGEAVVQQRNLTLQEREKKREERRIYEAAIKCAKRKTDEELKAWEDAYVRASLIQKRLSFNSVTSGGKSKINVFFSQYGTLSLDGCQMDGAYTSVKVFEGQVFALSCDKRLYVFEKVEKKKISKTEPFNQVTKTNLNVEDFWVGSICIAARMSNGNTYVKAKVASHLDDTGCVCMVAISASFAVALRPYGKLKIILGTVPNGFDTWQKERFISIVASNQHLLGLTLDGRVLAIGENGCSQCNVKDWNQCVAIAAGADYSLAITKDGQVLSTKGESIVNMRKACMTLEEELETCRKELLNCRPTLVRQIQCDIDGCNELKRNVLIATVRKMNAEVEQARSWVEKAKKVN